MKSIKRKSAAALVIVLSLIAFAEFGFASTLLPWVKFNGIYQATAGIGTGALKLTAFVNEIDYENGEVLKAYVEGVEHIYGARVVLSGAARTGNYSFNGDPANPDDVFFSIIGPDNFVYFNANLADSVFTQSGLYFVWLNQWLTASDPSTLNLYNITLNTDAAHPSRYINELAAYLGGSNVSGLKMQLRVPVNGNFTTNCSGSITYGLIDGLQSLNSPPLANAGENISIISEQMSTTAIPGTAIDPDGDPLLCRWLEGSTVLNGWSSAGTGGACPLELSGLALAVGQHTLVLEVSDGSITDSDDMLLTIGNSAPHAGPGGAGVYEINTPVRLTGDASDYDGDWLDYEWSEGSNILCSGGIQSLAGGTPVYLPDCFASGLSLGTHIISLQVQDALNLPDRKDITVDIIDSTVPTLAPVANNYLLWPPNHIMVNIAIDANAVDNSGLPVTLNATVTSNEPEEGLGDGDTGPYDWTQPIIDQSTGRIDLQLRRERSGSGTGRVYTVTITATDSSGNTSTAKVNITVPHDMGKKK